MRMTPVTRIALALTALGILAACEKRDATAGQAASAFNNLATQTGQKFDQATSYVGQKVDTAKQSEQRRKVRALVRQAIHAVRAPSTTSSAAEQALSRHVAPLTFGYTGSGGGRDAVAKLAVSQKSKPS